MDNNTRPARAPIASTTSYPSPQTETATAASTAEKAIADNSTGGAMYEFVAAGFVHVKFGVTGLGAATTGDFLVTTTPRRVWIEPALATHIRTIRNGAADVILSFSRVY